MRIFLSCLAFVLTVAAAPLSAQTPLPMPMQANDVSPATFEDVLTVVNGFNRYIGTWPPTFSSAAQRDDIYSKWGKALQQTWMLEAKDGAPENNLYLLAELYRQGHNMEVIGAGARANSAIEKCLKSFPDSINCHFSASYFYLTVDPKLAPKGEASLVRLRALFAPRVNINVERGLVFAYLQTS